MHVEIKAVDFMAWDLWGASYYQDQYEHRSYTRSTGHSKFVYDVIEENALNEKYCIQVLKILIAKAEIEVYELEEDLTTLQNELAYTEYEGWSDICCNALKEKIDCLDISIRSLRDEDGHCINVHLLMHREPAERIHEIVKGLLRNHFQDKDEQDVSSKNLISDYPTSGFLDEQKAWTGNDRNISTEGEVNEPIITPTETPMILSLSMQLQEGKDSKKLDYGHSDEDKLLDQLDSQSARNGECEEHSFKPKDSKLVQSLSLEFAKKWQHNVTELITSMDSLKHVSETTSENKFFSDSGSNSMEEVEENVIEAMIWDSLLGREKTDSVGKDELKNTTTVSSSDSLECGTNNICKKKKLGNSNLQISEEVEEHQASATENSRQFNVSGDYQINEEAVNYIVNGIGRDALRDTSIPEERLNGSKPTLGILIHAENRHPSGLEDISSCCNTLKTADKNDTNKKSKVVDTEGIGLSIASSNIEKQRRDLLQNLEVQEAGLTINEHFALSSHLELRDHEEDDRVGKQVKVEKLSPDIQNAKASVNDNAASLELSVMKQRQKARKKTQPNQRSPHRAGSHPVEVGLDCVKAKRRKISIENISLCKLFGEPVQKEAKEHPLTINVSKNITLQTQMFPKSVHSSIIEEMKGSNYLMNISNSTGNGIDIKREEDAVNTSSVDPSLHEARESDITGDSSKSSIVTEKSRKKLASPISIEIEDSTFHIASVDGGTAGGIEENDMFVKYGSEHGSCDTPVPGSSFSSVTEVLKKLTLPDLRALAKEHKLTKYSKLKKELIIKQLAEKLDSA